MSAISSDDVIHLAKLSNIELSNDEIAELQTSLGNILEYITQLGELDTTNVEPTYQVTGLQNVWREDGIEDDTVSRAALLELAPDKRDNQVKVPKVL